MTKKAYIEKGNIKSDYATNGEKEKEQRERESKEQRERGRER